MIKPHQELLELLEKYEVEIPIIQRDYAQEGRLKC